MSKCQICGDAIRGRPRKNNRSEVLCLACEEVLTVESTCAVCNEPAPIGAQFCAYCRPRATGLKHAAERYYGGGHG